MYRTWTLSWRGKQSVFYTVYNNVSHLNFIFSQAGSHIFTTFLLNNCLSVCLSVCCCVMLKMCPLFHLVQIKTCLFEPLACFALIKHHCVIRRKACKQLQDCHMVCVCSSVTNLTILYGSNVHCLHCPRVPCSGLGHWRGWPQTHQLDPAEVPGEGGGVQYIRGQLQTHARSVTAWPPSTSFTHFLENFNLKGTPSQVDISYELNRLILSRKNI